ncbi:BadF/BadG/BcrA/BcrD ATPase family protein [Ramlibacter albus]|uniref:ATPase n=1 Tax=Ramlibacter albus TaxID=2079448 RepID=A0A923MBZ8_9BURK|nr:BadF/BadG/BcrA/BcrD ATPase family protein [Ramlibacter albus]MBC5766262.1 ATPase [Ramlibacter albus]
MVEYVLGIDGGGSGTRAWLARVAGALLGRGDAGPSALGQGVAQAWRNVELSARAAFEDADVAWPGWHTCAAVCALSGVSNPPWREAFLAADPGLALLDAETDSFAMLVGALGGKPGAIVAAGTGSIGEVLRPDGTRSTVGGWGFPVGDEGSGAWLGLQAVRHAQAALDGRERAGPLAQSIWKQCGATRDALQAWCDGAGQFAYAQLAPAVFEYEPVDPTAQRFVREALAALEAIAHALDPHGRLPVAFAGSIAHRLAPRVGPALKRRVVEPAEGPAAGALALARRLVLQETETTH